MPRGTVCVFSLAHRAMSSREELPRGEMHLIRNLGWRALGKTWDVARTENWASVHRQDAVISWYLDKKIQARASPV